MYAQNSSKGKKNKAYMQFGYSLTYICENVFENVFENFLEPKRMQVFH